MLMGVAAVLFSLALSLSLSAQWLAAFQMSAPSKEQYLQQELERLSKKIDDEEKKAKNERDSDLLGQWRQEKKELMNQLPSAAGAGNKQQ